MTAAQKQFTLVIDQGTSSTKIFLFNLSNRVVFKARTKHSLTKPRIGHVEADASEIAEACESLIKTACRRAAELNGIIISAGIALQRSTFIFWDKQTLKPLTPALSWQDGRATDIVDELSQEADFIFHKTGAPLNAHFGGPKFAHMVRQHTNLAEYIKRDTVFYGTISAYLVHYLTGHPSVDESIASRFTLMDLDLATWDDDLLALFNVPKQVLPELVPSVHHFGLIKSGNCEFPLRVVIGDQQTALLGQGGYKQNSIAMNFGTSGSIQINAGETPAHVNGLISSVLYSDDKKRYYLVEGTINACNSIFYHLEDELNIPHDKMLWHDRCAKTETNGVYIPTGGLAAPYWADNYDPISTGYESDSPNEIIRAAMESIGFLTYDILKLAMSHLVNLPTQIFASGGGGRAPLLQFISNLTGISVIHGAMKDRTALGVHALLIKDYTGEWPELDLKGEHHFSPNMEQSIKTDKLKKWHNALQEAGITKS